MQRWQRENDKKNRIKHHPFLHQRQRKQGYQTKRYRSGNPIEKPFKLFIFSDFTIKTPQRYTIWPTFLKRKEAADTSLSGFCRFLHIKSLELLSFSYRLVVHFLQHILICRTDNATTFEVQFLNTVCRPSHNTGHGKQRRINFMRQAHQFVDKA